MLQRGGRRRCIATSSCLYLKHVTFPSITVFGRLVSALPALVELKCNYVDFTHDHFHHDAFGLNDNRVKIRFMWLEPIECTSETLIDFLAHPSISGHLRKLIFIGASQRCLLQV
ncbi:uncharacterized protein LAESUDRAFT_246515 [Laetiporus sulphureus 93-53]|uniref:F-box domain-containing protein n=1 Tax=Laetiporus sulphureus 93-53 TaxID=1314785 RepID=A0A165DHT3_9APHY|nr:uncharacterized protein LAESUDRAFT_246515 [Laetiporus sulphureus 93-53]KZT04910.1 hypothetical protein LAESUDRAFT_246515 [Laetiporus sulphureus 93-53]